MESNMNKTLNEYTSKNGVIISEKIAKDLARLSAELRDLGKRLEADLLKYNKNSKNNENK